MRAGPFDWIFSDAAMIAHCLSTSFASLLDPALYLPSADGSDRTAGHALYGPMLGRSTVFNHHNPALAADHHHFVRCTERFNLVLSSPRRKLLLLISKGAIDLAALGNLLEQVAARSAGHHFEILAIGLLTKTVSRGRRKKAAASAAATTAAGGTGGGGGGGPGGSGDHGTGADALAASPLPAPTARLVLERRAEGCAGGIIRAFEMRCVGGHSGLAFTSPVDEVLSATADTSSPPLFSPPLFSLHSNLFFLRFFLFSSLFFSPPLFLTLLLSSLFPPPPANALHCHFAGPLSPCPIEPPPAEARAACSGS